MASKRSLLGLALSASLLAPTFASAGAFSSGDYQPLKLDTPVAPPEDSQQSTDAAAVDATKPVFIDEAAAATSPQIHGFFDSPFKTAYITPRGLVVEDKGLVWQPVVGLVFPLPDIGLKNMSLVAGIWNSVNTHQGDPRVGAWNEMDVFVGVGGQITKELRIDIDYEAWNFPQATLGKPSTEHVSQTKLSYNDAKFWGDSGFALNPYLNFFWSISGSSTVVLGKTGSTYYFEPGIVPTYTIKGSTPITLSVPTYVSIGDPGYWGKGGDALHKSDGSIGVFSTGITATVPLNFIPVQYGHWHAEAGLLYYYLINDALLRAGGLISGNTDRSKFNAYVGVGVGF